MTQNTNQHSSFEENFDIDLDDVDMLSEQREFDRHEIATEGQIKLTNGFKIPVKVSDMSRSGARLRMKQFVVLPNEFEVEIFSPDRTKLKLTKSSRQWQRHAECGVKFLTARTILSPDGAY